MNQIATSALLALIEQSGLAVATLLWLRVYRQSHPQRFVMSPD